MLALIIFCILFTWLACAAVCIGIGGLLLRGLRFSFSALDALWSGVGVITAVLQVYHFFRPIDVGAVYLLMGLGLGGWIWNGAALLEKWRERKESRVAAVLLNIAAAAIIAFRCAALGEHYDTGLYGAQAVRWFITYPLVLGLGNLIGQLGFNSSVFLWFAALEQGPWCGLAHHLFDGFIIAVLFASIIPAALRILRAEGAAPIDWFLTLLFVPATIWGTTTKIVGTNTDLPTSVVCLVAGDEADHTGGEVGVGADDLGGGAPDGGGHEEQRQEPVNGGSAFGAQDSKRSRNDGGKQHSDYETVEKMVRQTAPGSLLQRREPQEDGRIKPELSN